MKVPQKIRIEISYNPVINCISTPERTECGNSGRYLYNHIHSNIIAMQGTKGRMADE